MHAPALHVGPDALKLVGPGLARMEYTFGPAPRGTVYENSLTLGGESWWGPAAMRVFMPRGHGEAWIKHNVEEVGAFEELLPALYYRETGLRA